MSCTDSLWTGLSCDTGGLPPSPAAPVRRSLAETISQGLLADFPCLFAVTSPESLVTKLDKLIRSHSSSTNNEEADTTLTSSSSRLLFPTSSLTRRKLNSTTSRLPPRIASNDRATVASSSSASRFLCDLAQGLPLSRPSQLWSLNEDSVVSPFSSMSFTSPQGATTREKLTSYQRRARFETSIPTTVGESSVDYGPLFTPRTDEIAKTISPGDTSMSHLWRSNPNLEPLSVLEQPTENNEEDDEEASSHTPSKWLADLTRPQDFTPPGFSTAEDPPPSRSPSPSHQPDYLFTGEFSSAGNNLWSSRGGEPPRLDSFFTTRRRPASRPSTQVFGQMLAALRDRGFHHQHHHHHQHNLSCPATVSPRSRGLSPLLSAPDSPSTRSPSGSQRLSLKSYVDDRERMVFVSWIPKRTRSYNSHEKRRLELELKAKLKEGLKINGVSKVLLFPPKGAHCKIIFQSRGCASEFMRRYGGDQGSVATERWKRDVCRAFDIEMTDRFHPTVVKIEWAQK